MITFKTIRKTSNTPLLKRPICMSQLHPLFMIYWIPLPSPPWETNEINSPLKSRAPNYGLNALLSNCNIFFFPIN